jgi:hypothetical protein
MKKITLFCYLTLFNLLFYPLLLIMKPFELPNSWAQRLHHSKDDEPIHDLLRSASALLSKRLVVLEAGEAPILSSALVDKFGVHYGPDAHKPRHVLFVAFKHRASFIGYVNGVNIIYTHYSFYILF